MMATTDQLLDLLAPLTERMRQDVHWTRKPGAAAQPRRLSLTRARMSRHFEPGEAARWIGACPIKPGERTTLSASADLDSHKGEVSWPEMVTTARQILDVASSRGMPGAWFSSSGGNGIHIHWIWDEPQCAYSVRRELDDVLMMCGLQSGTKGVHQREVEIFPKQDFVPPDGFGNMIVLPLAGKSRALDEAGDSLPIDHPIVWRSAAPVPVLQRPERTWVSVKPTEDLDRFRAALYSIPNTGEDELSYDMWFRVLASIHAATEGSDEGLAMAMTFSERCSKHDPDFLEYRVWKYLKPRDGGISDGYVFSMARQYGWQDSAAEDFDVVPYTPKAERFDALAAATTPPPKPSLSVVGGTDVPTPAAAHEFMDASGGGAAPPGKPAPPPKPFKFKLEAAHTLRDLPPMEWIIKGVIPRADIGMIYGPSGVGKTFAVLDLAISMALGVEWNGHKVKREERVLYVAAEGRGGISSRIAAAMQHRGIEHLDNLQVLRMPVDMMSTEEALLFCREAIAQMGRPTVVFLDTMAQSMLGGDENKGEDVGRLLENTKGMARAFGGATVILVHHTGKDESRGARGWSGLKGAMDFEIYMTQEDDLRVMQITKQKDGRGGAMFGFEFQEVQLGMDEDGDLITSCVVRWTTTTMADLDTRRNETRAAARGRGPTPEIDMVRSGITRLAISSVIEAEARGTPIAFEILIDTVVGLMPAPAAGEGSTHRDRRRDSVRRAVTKAVDDGVLVAVNGVIHTRDGVDAGPIGAAEGDEFL